MPSVSDSPSPRNPNPRPSVRADLDRIAQSGCGNPACRHKHEPQETIMLRVRCHERAGLSAGYSSCAARSSWNAAAVAVPWPRSPSPMSGQVELGVAA